MTYKGNVLDGACTFCHGVVDGGLCGPCEHCDGTGMEQTMTPTPGAASELLLPCPFCGSSCHMRESDGGVVPECYSGCFSMSTWYESTERAARDWNRRFTIATTPVSAIKGVTEAADEFVTFCADINHAYTFTDWSTFYRLRNNAIDELELRRLRTRTPAPGAASELQMQKYLTGSDDDLVDVCMQVYSRACRYDTQVLHDAAMAYCAELKRRLRARTPAPVTEGAQREAVAWRYVNADGKRLSEWKDGTPSNDEKASAGLLSLYIELAHSRPISPPPDRVQPITAPPSSAPTNPGRADTGREET